MSQDNVAANDTTSKPQPPAGWQAKADELRLRPQQRQAKAQTLVFKVADAAIRHERTVERAKIATANLVREAILIEGADLRPLRSDRVLLDVARVQLHHYRRIARALGVAGLAIEIYRDDMPYACVNPVDALRSAALHCNRLIDKRYRESTTQYWDEREYKPYAKIVLLGGLQRVAKQLGEDTSDGLH